ncbi:MAG: hypothetical protein KDB80_17115 [Planctomycetes bacterium]|nr:hypothetical protein [Planctomycetota bacterium]
MRITLVVTVVLAAAVLAMASTGRTDRHALHPLPDFQTGGTLMLTVEIDCDGISVLQCTEKPSLRFGNKAYEARLPFHWTLVDAEGQVITSGGFNPGPMELDPKFRGTDGRVEGCQLIPASTAMNIKVPAVPFHEIRFTIRRDREFEPFGTAVVGEFPVRR